jgi:hypothetical protein
MVWVRFTKNKRIYFDEIWLKIKIIFYTNLGHETPSIKTVFFFVASVMKGETLVSNSKKSSTSSADLSFTNPILFLKIFLFEVFLFN